MCSKQFGNYRLISSIGTGSCAEVFKAENIETGQQVAVKRYKSSVKQVEKQFLREAHIAASLTHPHIIKVLDFGLVGDIPYIAMDYAPNGSLDKLHPRGERLPLPTIVSYVKQIADALQYAHIERVIHRDIKPANVVLGEDGQLLVTDFSIAQIAHTTLSWEEQQIAGTLLYMPPEQFQGNAVLASDQYALGVMVYEWLCGELPFTGSITTLIQQHREVSPPPLHEKIPVPPAVETAVLKTLAKDPRQRFDAISDFAYALEQAYYIGEIGTRLSTPESAAKLLIEEHIQHILFKHLLRDPHWWSDIGRIMINSLRSQAEQESRTDIIALLSTLARRASNDLEVAIQREDEGNVINLLDLIYWARPPSVDQGVWTSLLKNLSAHPLSVTFITNKRNIYSGLLQQWGSIFPSIENECLHHWFPKTWPELWPFLSLSLPGDWHDIAVTNLLDTAPATPLPAPFVHSAEQECAPLLKSYLYRPFRSDNQQHTAIRLFTRLIESGYARKMELLHIMLTSDVGNRDQRNYIEKVLVAAQLTREEITWFLEQYGERAKSYYLLPIMWRYVRQYLLAFDPDDLDRSSAKQLVQFMSGSPSLPLPPDVQALAQNWHTIAGFIAQPMSSRLQLSVLAQAILQFQPIMRSIIIDKLVVSFISCVRHDIDLTNVIYAMGTVLAEPKLLRFLHRIAESVGNEYDPKSMEGVLVPYILIALQIETLVHFISDDEQQEFVEQFLNALLKHADKRNYKNLGNLARHWHSDLFDRWQRYMQRI